LPFIPLELAANNDYNLLFRYKSQPDTINVYSVDVKPYWWQTLWFKIVAIIFSLLILFVLIFYFYRNRKKQQLLKQQEETEKRILELKAIRSQLNPHFIFNSLSSIQGLINSNKIDDANYYLAEFSNLMRNTLIESDKLYQTLQKEIELLETYLKLEQLRFQFKYEMNVAANIKTNEIEIPSLLLQPLVENAVKHGVSELREKGKVSILFFTTANNLIAEIKDNGSGFNNKNKAEGFGLKLTYDRIVLLNKMNKDQIIDKKIFRINNETVIQIIFKNII
jgi:two-component system, LytTR family, sensor kinase